MSYRAERSGAVLDTETRNGVSFYESLNDAAAVKSAILSKGDTKIWYFKAGQSRDMMMGVEWLKEYKKLPTRETLEQTHALLGEVAGDHLDHLYRVLQGEIWSPNGEARKLIKSKGLDHTSMSVGDIIEIDGKLFIVDSWGFEQIKEV